MPTVVEIKARRAQLIDVARAIVETAEARGGDLTADEQKAVDANLAEHRRLGEQLAAHERTKSVSAAMSADAPYETTFVDGVATSQRTVTTGHVALTGKHAARLADKIINTMPRDIAGKALATGQQTTSTILLPGVVNEGRPAASVLDILPARIVGPSYSFLRQSARSFAAAPVAAGGEKPTSTVSVTAVPARLRVVAHISEAIDTYVLSDNDSLTRFVTDEMVYGLRKAVETEVLTGDGSDEHFTGILDDATGIAEQDFSGDILTSVRKGLTRLDVDGYTPGVIVLSAADWETLELLEAGSGATDVRGVPINPVTRTLWGVPVVLSEALGVATGLVIGDGAVTLDHDGRIDIKWSDSVGSDFSYNQVRCRVEGRWGVSVNQPGACVKVATVAGGS